MLWRWRRELLLLVTLFASLALLRCGHADRMRESPVREVPAMESVEELSRENARLRRLLALRERESAVNRTMAAEVIGGTPAVFPGELVINRGLVDGIRTEASVLSSRGWLVGRVISADERTATVRTVYHAQSRVSVLTASTRELGILEGGTYPILWVKYVSKERPPVVDEEVLTSGLSEFYPKGIPVGRVCVVERGREEFFVRVGVKPYIGSAAVEEVLVVR